MCDYQKSIEVNILNPLYLIINKLNGNIEENNEDKYLTTISTDKNKYILEKCEEL